MKNILISSSCEPDGGYGISTYAKEIAENFSNRGYKVYFLSPTPKDMTWLRKNNIIHLESNRNTSQAETCKKIYEKINNEPIDAIINNDNSIITSLSPALNCPIISIGHMEKRTIASLAAYNSQWMDYIVTISNNMKQTYTTKYNIPISKCPIIYNGLKKVKTHITPTTNSKLKVIFTGGYTKIKGSDLVVDMILTPSPVWDKIEFNWYGANLPKKIAQKIKSNSSVTIHGKVERNILMEELEKSDILLLASRLEGCPMSMLEAMSYGVVPIASNGEGAMQWLIDHGIHGYICDLKNWPSQSIHCLNHLSENQDILNQMKQSVLKHFNENFQTDNTVDKLISLLSKPTIDRTKRLQKIKVLKWHRPINASFIEKIDWRLGRLHTETTINLP